MNISPWKSLVRAWSRLGRRPDGRALLPAHARVLLLRHDRIGDAIVSTCVLEVLSKQRPGWKLDMVLGKENQHVLDGDTRVDRRWLYDKNPLATIRLVRKLQAQRYDIVLDLMDHASTTSMALVRLLEPAVTVGFQNPRGYLYDLPVPPRARKLTHVMDRLGDLLAALGCAVPEGSPRVSYQPSAESREFVTPMLQEWRAGAAWICGVNTSAGSASRYWGTENYRAFLGTAAAESPEGRFVVLAHPSDAPRAARIAEGMRGVSLGLSVPSFDSFAALVQGMDFLVTPDTSVVHLASAFGIPAVALFASGIKAVNWAPYATPHRSVIAPAEDFQRIEPAAVLQAWRSILAERP